jgi:hypothetical protein
MALADAVPLYLTILMVVLAAIALAGKGKSVEDKRDDPK